MIGLVIDATIQVALTWGSQRLDYPFAAPLFWDIIVSIAQYCALATAAAATVLLMVSVQLLDPNSNPIQTFSPKPVVYTVYGLFGSIVVILIIGAFVFLSTNGFLFLAQRFEERRKAKKELNDFISFSELV